MKFPRVVLASILGLVACAFCVPATSQEAATGSSGLPPQADVVVFKNGDQLTGKLVRGVGDSVVFKSDIVGEVTVPLAKVKELRSSSSFAVLRKGAGKEPPLRAPSLALADDSVTVPVAGAAPEVIPVKEMGYLIDQATYDREVTKLPFRKGWNGAITGGATLVRSTTTANNYTVGIGLVRTAPTLAFLPARNRTTLNALETYGKQTSPVIPPTTPASPDVIVKTSIFHGDAERDEYFTPRMYALADASFDHNYAQGLDLQQIYGAGLGWTLLKSPHQQLDAKVDAHYEMQKFLSPAPGVAAAKSHNLFGSTFGENYRRDLPRKLVFAENAVFLPAWNDANAFSLNVNAALVLPVYKRLGMQFSTTDNYLNDPAAYFKKNSYQFVTGITYSLH